MPKGTIRMLVKDRSFGFIHSQQGEDFFFHSNELRGVTYDSLKEGQQVEFQIGKARNGRPQAVEVNLAQTQSVPVTGSSNDEEEIRKLLSSYPYAVESGNPEVMMSFFTDDVRLVAQGTEYRGAAAVKEFYQDIHQGYENIMNKITNVVLDARNDTATGQASFMARLEVAGLGIDVSPEDDCSYKFVKEAGRWRINELILNTRWTQPVAWTYLRALQAENEIRRLLTTYAYAVDSKDINLLMSIFTYDVHLIFLSKEYKGVEAVRGYYLGFFALQEKMRHKIFNVELDVKHLMGKAYVTYQGRSLETGTDSTLECNYRYKYARVNGKWQINELSIEYQI